MSSDVKPSVTLPPKKLVAKEQEKPRTTELVKPAAVVTEEVKDEVEVTEKPDPVVEQPPVVETPKPAPPSVQAAPPPPPPPPPAAPAKKSVAVTAEDIEVSMEKAALAHLLAIAAVPACTFSLRDFRKVFPDLTGLTAKNVMQAYVENGLLVTDWRRAANRYSLTEAGQEKLIELQAKYPQ